MIVKTQQVTVLLIGSPEGSVFFLEGLAESRVTQLLGKPCSFFREPGSLNTGQTGQIPGISGFIAEIVVQIVLHLVRLVAVCPVLGMFGRLLFALILPAGGETSPDMPLGFILLQNLLHLKIQPPIKGRESLRQILVDGGFADAELFGGGTDGSTALYDVKGEIARPLLHVAFDSAPLLR